MSRAHLFRAVAASRFLHTGGRVITPRAYVTRQRVETLVTMVTKHTRTTSAVGIRRLQTVASDADAPPDMFCYQCEQTKSRTGCTVVGVCGKTAETAALQDLLVHAVKGLSMYGHAATKMGASIPREVYNFTFSALFSTVTNVNFDADRFPEYISVALSHREVLKSIYEDACFKENVSPEMFTLDEATWSPTTSDMLNIPELCDKGHQVGVLQDQARYGADVAGVRQMIIYGLKGMATYARHAQLLGHSDDGVGKFTLETLAWLTDGPESERTDLATNLGWALRVGEVNLKGLQLLDNGHRKAYGVPTPTAVSTTPVPGKCILVSGHDMHDLSMILQATAGTGINVYTHGEMLPAHGYPELNKYENLVGQFGTAWQVQKYEFPKFPGPIVVTTNCLTEPMKSYRGRIFTMNDVGWPDCQHLELPRDMDLLIRTAEESEGFTEEECSSMLNSRRDLEAGYGREFILSQADTLLEAVKAGDLQRIFLIGGCDGSENKRSYYATLAASLPQETLILTLGCAKYRINNYNYGMIPGTELPRLMDMGQCNDSYGAVAVAQALAEVLKTDINDLPLSITLSWFEQKAVAVLLSLLHLGVKNIRVGPVLPAFLTPTVVDILVDKFNIVPVHIRQPMDDLNEMLGKKGP